MIQIIQFYSILSNFTVKKRQALFHFLARVNVLHFDPILSILIQNDPISQCNRSISINSISLHGQTSLTFIQFYPVLSILIQNYPILSNFTVQKRQALIPFPRTGKRASLQPHKYQDDSLGQKLVAFSGRK